MARPAAAQDNFSDVTHPDPAEVASSVVAAAVQLGEISPQEPAFQAQVNTVVQEAGAGSMGEGAARQQIGNVATSVLIRAGVLSFEGGGGGPPPGEARRDDPGESP